MTKPSQYTRRRTTSARTDTQTALNRGLNTTKVAQWINLTGGSSFKSGCLRRLFLNSTENLAYICKRKSAEIVFESTR